MASPAPGGLHDPPIGADHQQLSGGVASFDQLFDQIIRLAPGPGVDGADPSGMDGSLPRRRGAVTDEKNLISSPTTSTQGFNQPGGVHSSKFWRKNSSRVKGVVGVKNDLHGLSMLPGGASGPFLNSEEVCSIMVRETCGPICGLQRRAGSSLIPGFTDSRVRSPKTMAIRIKSRQGESVNQMLRRFKKLCEKEGLTKDVKRKQYFEKPSERRRRAMRKAIARAVRFNSPAPAQSKGRSGGSGGPSRGRPAR